MPRSLLIITASILVSTVALVGLAFVALQQNNVGNSSGTSSSRASSSVNSPSRTITSTPSLINYDINQVTFTTMAQGLKVPWSVLPLDSTTLLVTERPGRINLVRGTTKKVVLALANTLIEGESGLMGITADPGFATNGFVYVMYAYKNGATRAIRVSRFKFVNDTLTGEKVILDGISVTRNHSGGELAFGPDGKLYVTTGENFDGKLAQNLGVLAGKILRINADGTVPQDNPFVGRAGARAEIWSWGHRNPQGIDWHPLTGELYSAEHGPSGSDGGTGMDEINWIRKGLNYGWPIIRGKESRDGMETPIREYTPAVAPSSVMFYAGDMFPELKHKLLVANLKGTAILALEIDGDRVVAEKAIVDGRFGRIRDLGPAPNGGIYFTTSNTDGRGDMRPGDDKIILITR